jgi:hypothetical protein
MSPLLPFSAQLSHEVEESNEEQQNAGKAKDSFILTEQGESKR